MRSRKGPAFVHATVIRPYSHSLSDDEKLYKTTAEREAEARRDPLVRMRHLLKSAELATDDELTEIQASVEREVNAGCPAGAGCGEAGTGNGVLVCLLSDSRSDRRPRLQPNRNRRASRTRWSASSTPRCATRWLAIRGSSSSAQDVADATREEALASVAGKGGVFKVTHGLQRLHGSDRVFNSPLAEANIVGRGVGMALRGLKPVVEIQFFDYIWPGFMQLRDEMAMMRYRSSNNWSCPMVVRVPIGGYLRGGAPYHSQSGVAIFAHSPGIRIAFPSNAQDASGLLRTAIRCDDPVLFLEHKHLYRQPYNKSAYPGPDYMVPFGKAAVAREGTDVVVFTWGALVHRALLAAAQAERDGLSVAVVDLAHDHPVRLGHDCRVHAEDQPRRGRIRRSAHLRLRRRDCRAYRAGTLRVPRRAGDARCRARLSGGLCARARGARFCRTPPTSSRRFAHLRRTDSEMRRVPAVVVLALALLHTNDRRQAGGRGAAFGWRSPASCRRDLRRTAQLPADPWRPLSTCSIAAGTRVYAVDSDTKTVIKLVEIGPELGRILQPRGFDTSANRILRRCRRAPRRRADTDFRRRRAPAGRLHASGAPANRLDRRLARSSMSGIASIQFTEPTLLISQPESGTLFTEYSSSGYAFRSVRTIARHRTRTGPRRPPGAERRACRSSIRPAAISTCFSPAVRCFRSTIDNGSLALRTAHRRARDRPLSRDDAHAVADQARRGSRTASGHPAVRAAAVDGRGSSLDLADGTRTPTCTTRRETRAGRSSSAPPASSARRACSSRRMGGCW